MNNYILRLTILFVCAVLLNACYCQEEYCACNTVELTFLYEKPSNFSVTVLNIEGDNTPVIPDTTITENMVSITFNGSIAADGTPINPLDQFQILIKDEVNNTTDTISNFAYDTYKCGQKLCDNRSTCVSIDQNLIFTVNGKLYSFEDIPITVDN